MRYEDKVYGEVEIKERVVLDLIESSSMQRLKGIDQHGYFKPFFSENSYNRFEHSMGVFILLRKFESSLLEQISGLLHDVSHTAFSHVADYVFDSGFGEKQNFQDDCFEEFIEKSEIPKILKKYGIAYGDILDDSEFLLKERELPDLCADRIDYFFRELEATNYISKEEIRDFLNNLIVVNNQWVLNDKKLAQRYAYLFLELNNIFWAGPKIAVMLKTLGDLIKYSFEKKIINKDDLFTTDQEVLRKIEKIGDEDEKLKELIDKANNRFHYKICDEDDYDLHVLCKSRVVDPLFLEKDSLKRVSEIDSRFAELRELNSKPKEYYIKFLGKK